MWADNRGLELNISQCHSIGLVNALIIHAWINENLMFFAGDTIITDSSIVFDRELDFYALLDGMCYEALKTLGFIKKSF